MNKKEDVALENFRKGTAIVRAHPLFGQLIAQCTIIRKDKTNTKEKNYCPEKGWAVVVDNAQIYVHPTRRGEPEEWAFVLAHCVLHLGLEHFKVREKPNEWNAACCAFVTRFLEGMKFGRAPVELSHNQPILSKPEEWLYNEFSRSGVPEDLAALSVGGQGVPDLWFTTSKSYIYQKQWAGEFASAIQKAVTETISKSATTIAERRLDTRGERARNWFVNHYPLLGALAATFEIVEDSAILERMDIGLGAVEPAARRIYINTMRLNESETKFVMAHEILHAALQHDSRCQGRDPFLFNISADFVINQWLVEMGIGQMPQSGLLLDPELKGLSAEAIYDRIVIDLRRYRKHPTFRGAALGDIISDSNWRNSADGMKLDDFYRQALQQGLVYHEEQGRGFLPAGLVDEIRALSQPPIPWDVELARWMDQYFQPIEKARTFARLSRRQSSTPDIPRPTWVPRYPLDSRTFGVVLDTSGSMWCKVRKNHLSNSSNLMNTDILGKALGAIASYAMSRDVPVVRVVFCDAAAYDQGYMPAEDLAGRVKLQGKGGTVLQPGINLLSNAKDFPGDAPILVITDGECDILKVKREHAFLMPQGRHLPFPPVGPVFRVS